MKKETITINEFAKNKSFMNFLVAKRAAIVEIISAFFILMFLYTALSKSFDISSTKIVLKKTPLFSALALEIAWGVVVVEYIIAALLFFSKTRRIGLLASLCLMTIFIVYITYMKSFVPNLPCSCGGIISKLNWDQRLAFNIFCVLLGLVGIMLARIRLESDYE